jgi:hypothetical protein
MALAVPVALTACSPAAPIAGRPTSGTSATSGSTAATPAVGPSATGTPSTTTPSGTTPSATASATTSYGGKVSDLVGRWAVHADGEPATTRLIVDGSAMTVWRKCGTIGGPYAAAPSGELIVFTNGFSSDCVPKNAPGSLVPWLDRATLFAVRGRASVDLLSSDGHVLAHLTPGGKPFVPSTVSESLADVPVLTAKQRSALDAPPSVPAPADLTPLTAESLTGSWFPVHGQRGYVTFYANGFFQGDDGCNRGGGPWRLTASGRLLMIGGPSTFALCSFDVPHAIMNAAARGIAGDRLVLVAATGERVELRRGVDPSPSPN